MRHLLAFFQGIRKTRWVHGYLYLLSFREMDDVAGLIPSVRNFVDHGHVGAHKGTDTALDTKIG